MSLDDPSVELKRPSESEDAPSNGKKSKTEDPLVAANALAAFARPSTEEEGSAAADTSPHSEDPPPDKGEEVIAQQVSDDDDTEATAGTESAASASDSASVAATAASRAIQDAMNTVKQEQHVLAEREEAVKRQRSKAARFCADSRARRRLRTMIFEQSADPATQQLRIAQMQQLQQSQIRNQQLQHGVDAPRSAAPVAVQTAQYAAPLSYLHADQAAAARVPFFPDPAGTALSLPAQLLASHGASWNPFTAASLPIASPLTQTPLAHSSMGFSAASAFAASLGVAAAPAAALPSLGTPGEFGALATGPSVFRSPVILDGSGHPATAAAGAAASLPSAARPASQQELGTAPPTAAAYPATAYDISAASLFAGQLPPAGPPAVLPGWS